MDAYYKETGGAATDRSAKSIKEENDDDYAI